MGGHQDVLAFLEVRKNLLLEVGDGPLGIHFQALTTRGRNVERTPPNVHLFRPMNLCRLRLVQALQVAIVSLVEPLVSEYGNVV